MSLPTELQENEILDWREVERLRIVDALAERLPALLQQVDTAITEELTFRHVVHLSRFHDRVMAPLVGPWIKEQHRHMAGQIARSSDALEARLHPERFGWTWNERLGIGATAAFTLAPVAAVPTVAGAIVVTTTTLFVFTSSAISLPVLGAALIGAAIWGGASRKLGTAAVGKVRERYRRQVHDEIRSRVLGDPGRPETPSLQRTLLEDIDVRARGRLEALR